MFISLRDLPQLEDGVSVGLSPDVTTLKRDLLL